MPYLTSIERRRMSARSEDGYEQRTVSVARKFIVRTLTFRFGKLPATISRAIEQLDDLAELDELYAWSLHKDAMKFYC